MSASISTEPVNVGSDPIAAARQPNDIEGVESEGAGGKSAHDVIDTGRLENWENAASAVPGTSLARNILSKDLIFKTLLDPNINTDKSYIFNVEMSKESKQVGPITDQKATGRCWLYSAANRLRIRIAKHLGLSNFQLSMAYLHFYDKLEKANHFLEQMVVLRDEPIDSRLVSFLLADPMPDGGRHNMFENLVCKYGILPASLFSDSFSAASTNSINAILSSKLRAYALEIRRRPEAESLTSTSESPTRSLDARRDEMMRDIYRTLTLAYRVPPRPDEEVVWQYYDKNGECKTWTGTPKGLYEEYKEVEHFSLVNDPRYPYETVQEVALSERMVGGKPCRHVNMPIDQLASLVIASLQSDRPVVFTCEDVIAHHACSRSSGIMDTDLYDLSPFGVEYHYNMSKKDRLAARDGYAAHSMMFTAVHLDDQGKAVRYKVENSLGSEHGKNGWFMMTQEWFEEFVYEVVVPMDMATERQREVLEGAKGKKVVKLDPWDVMA